MRLTEKQNPKKRAILLPLVTDLISGVEYIKDDGVIAFNYDASDFVTHLPKDASEDIFVLIQIEGETISVSAVLDLSFGSPKWNKNQMSIFDAKTEYIIELSAKERNRLLVYLLKTIANNS